MVRTDSPALTAVVISFFVVGNIILWMISIAALGLGVMHLKDCPLQPYIPIYLVVIGVSSMASLLMTYIKYTIMEENVLHSLCSICVFLIHFFNICWFISGNVWVYSVHAPNYNQTSGKEYCQKTIYNFAFWLNSLGWVAVGLLVLCGSYFLLYTCVKCAFRDHHLFPSNRDSGGEEKN